MMSAMARKTTLSVTMTMAITRIPVRSPSTLRRPTTQPDDEREEKTMSTPMMLRHNIAINLRLTNSWFREYQVLEGHTHPNMTMLQNGGYLLTGTKLCPRTGTNELDEGDLRKMRARLSGRRKQLTHHMQKKNNKGGGGGKRKAAEEGKMGDVSKRKK
jgi:hypothetical protein